MASLHPTGPARGEPGRDGRFALALVECGSRWLGVRVFKDVQHCRVVSIARKHIPRDKVEGIGLLGKQLVDRFEHYLKSIQSFLGKIVFRNRLLSEVVPRSIMIEAIDLQLLIKLWDYSV